MLLCILTCLFPTLTNFYIYTTLILILILILTLILTDNSIYYYSVEWDPSTLPWVEFRANFIGPTNPANASTDSLRGYINTNWETLGLPTSCTMGDNGVHASASPLEGLSEKMNWLGKTITDEPFGKSLLSCGIDESTIKVWNVDTRVTLSDGTQASIFDTLDDKQVNECMKVCIEIYTAANTATPVAEATPAADETAPAAEETTPAAEEAVSAAE